MQTHLALIVVVDDLDFLRVANKQMSIPKRVTNTTPPVTQMTIISASKFHSCSTVPSVSFRSGATDTTLPWKLEKSKNKRVVSVSIVLSFFIHIEYLFKYCII